jgi:hypothetical protein
MQILRITPILYFCKYFLYTFLIISSCITMMYIVKIEITSLTAVISCYEIKTWWCLVISRNVLLNRLIYGVVCDCWAMYFINSTAEMNYLKKGKWSVDNLIITVVVCIIRTCIWQHTLNPEFWKGLVTSEAWMDQERVKKILRGTAIW